MAAVPVLTYTVKYSWLVDLFVASCIAAATIGYASARKPARTPPNKYWRQRIDADLMPIIGAAGVIGNLALLYGASRTGISINPSILIANLSEVREESLGSAASGGFGGPFALLGSFLSPCSFLYLVLSARLTHNRALAWANFGLIVFVAFAYFGGRQTIIVAILLLLCALWLRGRPILRFDVRTTALLGVAVVAGWYFVTTFSQQRQKDSDPSYLLRVTGRAEYKPWIKAPANRNETLGSSVLQFSYFSTPLPSLTFWMQQTTVPAPLLGQYSFPLPAQLLSSYLGDDNTDQWQKARRKVFLPFSSRGYLDNAWATGLRDLVADFSPIGAVIFYALLGVFMAWARNLFEMTGGAFYHALESYAAVLFGFGAFQSLLYTDYFSYGLFLAWGVVIIQSGRRGPRRAAQTRVG